MIRSRTSVVIPSFNSASFIHKAIDSALNQSLQPLEVIVVDDGSRDNTCEVLGAYGDRIILIRQKNSGPAAARNAGMKMAKGDFIALLDADDYWHADFIKHTENFLTLHKDAVSVSTGWTIHQLNEKKVEFPNDVQCTQKIFTQALILDDFFTFWSEFNHVLTGTVLFRRGILDVISGQRTDLRISEDLEFWAMISTQGKWGFIPYRLWTGDSQVVSAKSGWIQHYQTRHKMCPTIEQWQDRLVAHGLDKIKGFSQVRGHVALDFTHIALLKCDILLASRLSDNFRDEYPQCKLAYLIINLGRFGRIGIHIASCILRINFIFKSILGKLLS